MRMKLLMPYLALFVTSAAFAGNPKDCSFNCFNTAITSMERTEDGCYNYTMEVSYSGDCTFALSHFTVETTCGTVTALSNSENWAQEIGIIDPATGLSGFKIDDIKEFGKSKAGSFTVNVTICPDDVSCTNSLSCWNPVVAYKAGQCVDYDTISYRCSKLNAALTAGHPTCADSNDGSVTLEIEEGQDPFSYRWSTGDTTKDISGLPGGNYSVTIFDAHGDTLNLSTELIAPEPLSLNYEISNASCGGNNDGAIMVNAKGGTGSYTYQWAHGSSENAISNLAPGQYEVTVADQKGCTYSESFTVGSIDQVIIDAEITKASCAGNDAAIDLTVSGGSGNYTFQWLDGATTEDREGLSSGFYNVTVTDEGGCQSSRIFSVKTENPLKLSSTIIPTGCPDDNTGGVELSVSGASGALSYEWSTGNTTANLSGVGKGRYEVTVTDEAGCSVTKSFYVFAQSMDIQSSIQHPSCYGEADGFIQLTSDEDITVNWSNGATSSEIPGLAEGLYTATVTNAAGCETSLSFYINAPDEITLSALVDNATCEASGNTATLSIEGGTAPYTAAWGDGFTGISRENLAEGTYNITVTDNNGCQSSGEVVIEAPECSPEEDGPTDEENPEGDDGDESNDNTDNPDYNGDEDNENPEEDGGDDENTGDNEGEEENPEDESQDENGEDGNTEEEDADEGPDNEEGTDGNDDNNERPGEGSKCGEPFAIDISLKENGECMTYEGKITYSGEKSYGLSHAVISTSCGDIEGTYTETGKFENGQDPTTGIGGLKIDEVNGFGEGDTEEKLLFEFNLCNDGCESGSVAFIISYKFGQCIDYDTVTVELPEARVSATAYPNPAAGMVNFNFDKKHNEPVQVELYNKYGLKVKHEIFNAGDQLQLDIHHLPNDLYTYRIISGKNVANGKIIVVNN